MTSTDDGSPVQGTFYSLQAICNRDKQSDFVTKSIFSTAGRLLKPLVQN